MKRIFYLLIATASSVHSASECFLARETSEVAAKRLQCIAGAAGIAALRCYLASGSAEIPDVFQAKRNGIDPKTLVREGGDLAEAFRTKLRSINPAFEFCYRPHTAEIIVLHSGKDHVERLREAGKGELCRPSGSDIALVPDGHEWWSRECTMAFARPHYPPAFPSRILQ